MWALKHTLKGHSTSMRTNNEELCAKVEAFVHFTYIKCKETCTVLDLQGCDYKSPDPEIATMTVRDERESWLYGWGYESAIINFFDDHVCNKYRRRGRILVSERF